MTCGHIFLFKGAKKVKVLLRQCCIMFFLLASSQGVSWAICMNTNLHTSPAANTLSCCTLTFVLQRLYQQHRAKPHSQLCVSLGLLLPRMTALGFVPWEVYHQLLPLVNISTVSIVWNCYLQSLTTEDKSSNKSRARSLPALARNKGSGNFSLP